MENPDFIENDIFFGERQVLAHNLEQQSMRQTVSAMKLFVAADVCLPAIATFVPEAFRHNAYAVPTALAVAMGVRAVQAVTSFKYARAINPKLPN